jgi:probable addiction module antidote protein
VTAISDTVKRLDEAARTGDLPQVLALLGLLARAYGMTRLAAEMGVSRASLYKALAPNGNPEFATVLKVAQALRLRLRFLDRHQPPPSTD